MIDVFTAFDWVKRNLSCNTAYIASIKLNFLYLVISRSTHACPAFSTPANLVPRFPVPRFQRPLVDLYHTNYKLYPTQPVIIKH